MYISIHWKCTDSLFLELPGKHICFKIQDKSLLVFTVTAKIRREILESVLFEIFFGLIMLHVYMNYSISCFKFHLIYINSVFLVPSSMYSYKRKYLIHSNYFRIDNNGLVKIKM